ncbi:MAG: hypothetical protein ACP5UH_03695 [Candidatus Micrarchaeia archaeon]
MGCPSGYPQYSAGSFANGQSGTYQFSSTPIYSFPPFGSVFSGQVWAVYTILQYSGNLTTQMATIVAKNVGASSTSPSSALYVPITITNSQSAATPAPFQQMITFNPSSYAQYENSNLGNIRFYQGSTELHSWCESGCSSTASQAVFWVNLPNGIPASSKVTVNMAFEPASMNYDGVYAGEAPQLSSTYAQYDDGASVFNNYWNFAGTSLPSGLVTSGSGGTITINNGIHLVETTAGDGESLGFSTAQSTNNRVREAAINLYGSSGSDIRDRVNPSLAGTSIGDFGYFSQSSLSNQVEYYFNGWIGTYTPTFTSATSPLIIDSQSYTSSGTCYWDSYNYGSYTSPIYQNSYTFTAGSTYTNGYAATLDSGGSIESSMYIYWIRIRAYPPNGVMPSVSFGSVQ